VPGAWDGFELAVRAILGQQITVSAATRLAGKLVASYGDELPDRGAVEPELTHVFPRPQQLAGSDLAEIGMPKARRMALSSLAAAVVADPQIFGPRRSLDEAIAQLRSLPGVGEWTAQYIAMRELREPDAFPAADIGLMRAMSDASGVRPSPAALLANPRESSSTSRPSESNPAPRFALVAGTRTVTGCSGQAGTMLTPGRAQ